MDSASSLTGSQKDELMDQVKQQIAVANAQELLTKKCFKKCINKPGTSLDSSEQKCVAMCMDRYMDSWNLISKAYSMRIQRERGRIINIQHSFRVYWYKTGAWGKINDCPKAVLNFKAPTLDLILKLKNEKLWIRTIHHQGDEYKVDSKIPLRESLDDNDPIYD
ncbi:hypothetical protein NQ317_014927 [Molorchus minor]|uniref:Tim10-like domain-containing protein n=1 Tax=Molorchus minor TaxID=1323400 RepID=A0ABQ9K0S2_9CUCU|nr:hypothetical protein NQ317_014927 [Molorchus minor]